MFFAAISLTSAGMPCITVRLSLNELGAVAVALASPNLLESTARAMAAAATIQVNHAINCNTFLSFIALLILHKILILHKVHNGI